ncbi:MAG: DUF1330 domain-containing protein [Parvibaculum sp.]
MSVYAIGIIEIADKETYANYEAGFFEALAPHGGEIVAVDDEPTTIEGEPVTGRAVVLRFASQDKFNDWYNSDAYQKIAKFRFASSKGRIWSAKAFEMPPA